MKNLKVKSILFSLLAVMAVAVFMTSCKKDETTEVTEESSQDIFLIDFPEINNDVLKFRDVEHFKTVYEKLNKLYDEDDQKFNERVKSLHVNSVYNMLSNDVFTNPQNRYQPFLTDPVMMSLVNKNLEFQVSKVLHTYVTNDVILTADINDTETRSKIRTIKKGAISSKEVPAKAYPINDDDFESLLGPWGNKSYDVAKIVFDSSEKSGGCRISGETAWDWKVAKYSSGEALSYRAAMYKSWGWTYEEAKVYNYIFENGQWKNKDGNISAHIWADRRNNTCQWNDREDERKWCGSCKDKRARVNRRGSWHHSSRDVHAQYVKRIDNESVFASHSITF